MPEADLNPVLSARLPIRGISGNCHSIIRRSDESIVVGARHSPLRYPTGQYGCSQGFYRHREDTLVFFAGVPPVKCPRFFPGNTHRCAQGNSNNRTAHRPAVGAAASREFQGHCTRNPGATGGGGRDDPGSCRGERMRLFDKTDVLEYNLELSCTTHSGLS
jgi:hypothetical protein